MSDSITAMQLLTFYARYMPHKNQVDYGPPSDNGQQSPDFLIVLKIVLPFFPVRYVTSVFYIPRSAQKSILAAPISNRRQLNILNIYDLK